MPEVRTGHGILRRARERGRRGRFLPIAGRGSGWRSSRASAASVEGEVVNPLRIWTRGRYQHVRKGEGMKLGREKAARPYLCRRNRAGMPADTSGSDEKSRRSSVLFGPRKGGERGRRRRGFI
jgi:hypothetical protein